MENKEKIGEIILIIGRKGSGKSPTCKALREKAKQMQAVIYDPRSEYSEENNLLFREFKYFREYCNTAEKKFIIFDEATPFLSKNSDLLELLISCEHKNNVCLVCSHSLIECSPFLLRLARYLIMLPTNDDSEVIRTSRPKLYPFFLQSQKTKKPVYVDMNNIN